MSFNEELQDWIDDDIPTRLIEEMEHLKKSVIDTIFSAITNPDDSIMVCRLQTRYRTYCDIITAINAMVEAKQNKEGEPS